MCWSWHCAAGKPCATAVALSYSLACLLVLVASHLLFGVVWLVISPFVLTPLCFFFIFHYCSVASESFDHRYFLWSTVWLCFTFMLLMYVSFSWFLMFLLFVTFFVPFLFFPFSVVVSELWTPTVSAELVCKHFSISNIFFPRNTFPLWPLSYSLCRFVKQEKMNNSYTKPFGAVSTFREKCLSKACPRRFVRLQFSLFNVR